MLGNTRKASLRGAKAEPVARSNRRIGTPNRNPISALAASRRSRRSHSCGTLLSARQTGKTRKHAAVRASFPRVGVRKAGIFMQRGILALQLEGRGTGYPGEVSVARSGQVKAECALPAWKQLRPVAIRVVFEAASAGTYGRVVVYGVNGSRGASAQVARLRQLAALDE